MERETGLEPATSSLGSWTSQVRLQEDYVRIPRDADQQSERKQIDLKVAVRNCERRRAALLSSPDEEVCRKVMVNAHSNKPRDIFTARLVFCLLYEVVASAKHDFQHTVTPGIP